MLKNLLKSQPLRLTFAAVVLTIGGAVFLSNGGKTSRAYEPSIERLAVDSLSGPASTGLRPHCLREYEVGLFHLYFLLGGADEIKFFRIDFECQHLGAHMTFTGK